MAGGAPAYQLIDGAPAYQLIGGAAAEQLAGGAPAYQLIGGAPAYQLIGGAAAEHCRCRVHGCFIYPMQAGVESTARKSGPAHSRCGLRKGRTFIMQNKLFNLHNSICIICFVPSNNRGAGGAAAEQLAGGVAAADQLAGGAPAYHCYLFISLCQMFCVILWRGLGGCLGDLMVR